MEEQKYTTFYLNPYYDEILVFMLDKPEGNGRTQREFLRLLALILPCFFGLTHF